MEMGAICPPEDGDTASSMGGSVAKVIPVVMILLENGRIDRHAASDAPSSNLLADGVRQRHPRARATRTRARSWGGSNGVQAVHTIGAFRGRASSLWGCPAIKYLQPAWPNDRPAYQENGMKLTPTALA